MRRKDGKTALQFIKFASDQKERVTDVILVLECAFLFVCSLD